MSKFILITGGVVSSLGKGIAAASIGCILEAHGYTVSNIKIDPYLNYDPGTMSPYQHGEVYVTEDGAETDLDLGHYERFTSATLTSLNSLTNGKILSRVIEKERRGDFAGETIQYIPHVTDEIKRQLKAVGDTGVDFVIAELGGTVGDLEGMTFLEAFRQFSIEERGNVMNIHLALAPYLKAAGEIKTKPVQNSAKMLWNLGIAADVILVRAEHPLERSALDKIALFCNVTSDNVFQAVDVTNIYQIPAMYAEQGLDKAILNKFRMQSRKKSEFLSDWKQLLKRIEKVEDTNKCPQVSIAVVGKYTELQDAYKSIYESLKHASYCTGVKVNVVKFNSETLTEHDETRLKQMSGILVPGGFGNRGIEGKIRAAQIARENKIPYFGICLGLQIAVIEFARNVAHLQDVNSTEFAPNCKNPVISMMEEQKKVKKLGGTMRLGAFSCELSKDSKAIQAYKSKVITERHRHRFEFNNKYRLAFKKLGLNITGKNPDLQLAEMVEIADHPWFVGCQFHPEFKSKPLNPHPLFVAFIDATNKSSNEVKNGL
jgi:CTP synthase